MVSVALIFGAETVVAGIVGIVAGSFLGQKLRRIYPTADPLVCGVGLFISAPFMLGTLILASGPSAVTTFAVMFFGQLFLNLNWSLVADITLVKLKSCRSRFNHHVLIVYVYQVIDVFPRLYPSIAIVSSYQYLFFFSFDLCTLVYRTFSA